MPVFAPYKYNPAETPPEDLEKTFIGREDLLQRLLSAIREQSGRDTIQHYLLLGPRGIGKTTMLLMLQRRLKADPELSQQWLCVRYREEEFYVHTMRDLLALALENLHEEEGIEEAGAMLEEAEAEAEDERSLAIILSGLKRISSAHGKRILLLIDNFDLVFPKRIESALGERSFRRLLSTEPFFMVVGTSVQLFEDIAGYDDAFFNFLSPIPMENLTDEQIEELLHRHAELEHNTIFLRNYDANRDKIRAITFLTGGNPRLVLMLYDILSQKQMLSVVETLRETIDKLTPLLKDVLEDMPAQQSKILDALMRLNGVASPTEIAAQARLPLNAVATQLGRLKESRFVLVNGGGRGKPSTYRVADQMFKTWYQMRYLRPARRRIEIFVEFLRAWFSVEDRMNHLDRMRVNFQTCLSSGHQRLAKEILSTMEYYAASLEDVSLRTVSLANVADAYCQIGDLREAALTLADLRLCSSSTQLQHEAAGYVDLGDRLVAREDYGNASKAFNEALRLDPKRQLAKFGLAHSLVLSGDAAGACVQLSEIMDPSFCADTYILAIAFAYRGFARYTLQDLEGAIKDLTAAVETEAMPRHIALGALSMRGKTKLKLGNAEGAMADFTEVIQAEDASKNKVAEALNLRGVARKLSGDLNRAVEDWSVTIEMDDVAREYVVQALNERASARFDSADYEGAISDSTAVIDMKQVPIESRAVALFRRSASRYYAGETEGAEQDLATLVDLQNAPSEIVLIAHYILGKISQEQGNTAKAVPHFAISAERVGHPEIMYDAVASLACLAQSGGKTDEIEYWLGRLKQLEPADIRLAERIEGRISIIVELATRCSIDSALEALNVLSDAAEPAVRNGLTPIRAALEYVQTQDESVLAKLPQEEQEIAKHIAERILHLRKENS